MTATHSTATQPESACVRLRVDNAIRLNVAVLQRTHRTLLEAVKADLVFDNPEYVKLIKLGKKGWGVPPKIALYEFDRATKDLTLPRGYLSRLLEHLNGTDLEYTTYPTWVQGSPAVFRSQIQLRDYQVEPVDLAVEEGNGVIVAPPGSGKTILGLEIIARLGRKSLWVTHTKDLAEQTLNAAEEHLGLSGEQLGLIGDGSQTIGTHLTVGMVQTLIKQPPAAIFGLDDVGTVILDEAHHCPAETFQQVIAQTTARYRLGLTATPARADGMEPAMYAVIGPELATVTTESLFDAEQILRPIVLRVATGLKLPYQSEIKNAYQRLAEAVAGSRERNMLIASKVVEEYKAGHSCLVLSSFIAHLDTLADLLHWDIPQTDMAILTSHTFRADRTAILDAAKQRRIRVVLATQLADEGLDIPVLDRLFLAMPKRAASKAVQQVGRILRPAPGKVDAVVYDFVDDVGVLISQWRSRRRAYFERGFVVK